MCISPKATLEQKDDIMSYSRKVFNSQLGKNSNDDPSELKEKIVNKVANRYDNTTVYQCSETTQRFLMNPTIQRKT